jgi:hypothetical protein
LGRSGKESRTKPRQDEKGAKQMSDRWSEIFKIFISNDGSYYLYLEEQEACVDLIENISDEIEVSDFAEIKKASKADLRDDFATMRLDNVRRNLPPMALKVAKLTERELLDLAQEIIQTVQDKNKIRLEIVK